MREFLKVICVVVFMFSAVPPVFAWMENQPTLITHLLRYLCPLLALVGLAGFLKIHCRKDEAPDYLAREVGGYFNRGGFCFGFKAIKVKGVCYLETYFQNQFEKECEGQIALRPARGFFLTRAKMDTIVIRIPCGAGAFGVARIALPVPAKLQGKRQSFEVGASVDYPDGKGKQLRFGDGTTLRANSNFGDAFSTTLTVAAAFTGSIVISSPATVKIDLPEGIAEDAPMTPTPDVTTLWELGDAELQDE